MKELYNGLPLFNMVINDEDQFENISLVDDPAIEKLFVAMSKDEEVMLSKIDNSKHIVSGPVLIPDKPIIRRNKSGYAYYIQFSKETIEQMALRFFGDHSNTNGNLMHQVDVDGIIYFESYIINRERGICPVEFSDCPDGTWVVSAKILNDKVWKLIEDGILKGFSISSDLSIKKTSDELNSVSEFLDYLKNNQ